MRYFLAACWVGVGVALQPGGGNWPPERRRPEPTRAALESMTLDPDQDCEMRRLAYAHALSLQPDKAPLREVFDALNLDTKCNEPPPAPVAVPPPFYPTPHRGVLFVDYEHGHDDAVGDQLLPLKTLATAVRKSPPGGTVLLRAGVHFLRETVELDAASSQLTIQNFEGERVWLSGGRPLGSGGQRWKKHPEMKGVWTTVLNKAVVDGGVEGLNALSADGSAPVGMVRARHPNRDPAVGTMEKGWLNGGGATRWTKPKGWAKAENASDIAATHELKTPNGTELHAGKCGAFWSYGVGGPCSRYAEGGGYLCSDKACGGGFDWEQMVPGSPLFPVGLSFPEALFKGAAAPANWSTSAETGTAPVVQTWTNGWCTTMWEVEHMHAPPGENATLRFGAGGQQTGRGFHIDDRKPDGVLDTEGGWRIENVLELLDAPEEWFFAPKTRTLYLHHNESRFGAGSTPNDVAWVVPTLKTLVRVGGSVPYAEGGASAVGVTLRGLGWRDSPYTYLDQWGVPSGGDWALHRGGALFVENAEDLTVEQCRFERLDGNALFLSGYTRGVTISNSTFAFIGDNAVALWGRTAMPGGADEPGWAHKIPAGVGIDGTGGEQPRHTKFFHNIVREIGFNERQSSAFSEAKACQSTVEGNILFNMPRAAINKNDGFGGGTTVTKNLLFNTCRESGDHGPFNSWDRQPFLTDVLNGAEDRPSLIPAYNVISSNYIIANYGAGFGVDNDDSSSYYKIHGNVFYLGGGVKCDYDGHEKAFYNNIMVAQSGGAACHHTCAYAEGHPDSCYNNTIVQALPREEGGSIDPFAIIWFCNKHNPKKIMKAYHNAMLPIIHSNKVYNANGTANVTCGYTGAADEVIPLEKFLDVGLMKGE